MGPTQRRYCTCGASREAPASLRVVACVRCGRELTARPETTPPLPSAALAMLAALVSQLLGALGFCAVVAWAWSVGPEVRVAAGVLLALASVWVFAGGSAVRGSVSGLVCCAVLDLAVALAVLGYAASAHRFVYVAAVRFVPSLVGHVDTVLQVLGSVAALGALACVAALPQVRRVAAWHEAQLARFAPVTVRARAR